MRWADVYVCMLADGVAAGSSDGWASPGGRCDGPTSPRRRCPRRRCVDVPGAQRHDV